MHKINHHNRNPYRKPDVFPALLLPLPMLIFPTNQHSQELAETAFSSRNVFLERKIRWGS